MVGSFTPPEQQQSENLGFLIELDASRSARNIVALQNWHFTV